MDAAAAAAGKRRREAAAAATAALRPDRSLASYSGGGAGGIGSGGGGGGSDGDAGTTLLSARGNITSVELSMGKNSGGGGGDGGSSGPHLCVLVELFVRNRSGGDADKADAYAALVELLPWLQALRHPSLPPIEAAFVDNGRAYLQRPCAERNPPTLEAWLSSGGGGGGGGGSSGGGRRALFEVCEAGGTL
jgi:hypothetical protein